MAAKLRAVQLVALHDTVSTKNLETLTELHRKAEKAAFFKGRTKTYAPYGDKAEDALPPDNQMVQLRAREVIAQLRAIWGEVVDVTYQLDLANCEAKAPIVVDGIEITQPLPVTTLMYIIKRVEDLRTFIKKMPTPDAGIDWVWDGAQGLLKSREAIITNRTAKVKKVIVKAEATEKFPAQAEVYDADVVVGQFTQRDLSGALEQPITAKIIDNIEKLYAAVKVARDTANADAKIDVQTVADKLLNFVFQPITEADVAKASSAA